MVAFTIEPPPAPSRERTPGSLLAVAAGALLVAFLAGGGVGFWLGRRTAHPDRGAAEPGAGSMGTASPAPAGSAIAPPSAIPQPLQTGTAAPAAAPTAATPPTPAAPSGRPEGGAAAGGAEPRETPAPAPAPGVRRLAVRLSGPLEDAITAALPRDDREVAGQLTQVVNRILVWDLQVARDGRKGDTLEVVFAPPRAGGGRSDEPVVEAVRYDSQKLGKAFAAYRFQADGAPWARYYRADGAEVEERLVDGPIRDYDQVTSLLRDGRRHKGVDFRTPPGTPVYAPFDGVVTRRNWNFAGNGNCLDVRDPATGRHAIFLHLEVLPKDMAPGRRVRKGERIASSGNSGRSFAPHLHYQLEAPDGRVLDPFAVHATTRVALAGPAKAAFDAARARLDAELAAR